MLVFMMAMGIFIERNERYDDLWSESNCPNTLHQVKHKFARIKSIFGGEKYRPVEDPLNDWYDLLNYSVFFIRHWVSGRL